MNDKRNAIPGLMETSLGVKIVRAFPMTRREYCDYRGWNIPENEDPAEKVYLVEYEPTPETKPNHQDHAGYISMSPAHVFEESYRPIKALTFGLAIEAMKTGKKVCRTGWNGKGMFVVYQKGCPDGIPCNKQTAEAWGMHEGESFVVQPYFQIRNVNGSHSMWVPSINDCLAEDWQIVD